MPDFGLTKALEEAVRLGAKGAKVMRPAEKEIAAQAAAKAEAQKAAEADVQALAKGPEKPAPEAPAKPVEAVKPTDEPLIKSRESKAKPAPEPIPESPAVPETVSPAEDKLGRAPDPTAAEAPPEPARAPPAGADPTVPPMDQIARRLSKVELGDYDLAAKHIPNLDRVTDASGIKAIIADLAEVNKAKITKVQGPVRSNEALMQAANVQTQKLAASEGTSADQLLSNVEKMFGNSDHATIVAVRQLRSTSAQYIKDLSDKIVAGTATDMDRVSLAHNLQLHQRLGLGLSKIGANWGRGGQAFRVPVGAGPVDAARIDQIIKNMGGDIDRLAKAVHLTNSVEGINKVVSGGLFSRAMGAVNHVVVRNFVGGILSGVKTSMKNIGGNVLFQGMNTVELGVAAQLGRVLPGVEHVQLGEAMASLHGNLNSLSDAWRLSWQALKTGETLDGLMKYRDMNEKTVLERLPELNRPILKQVIQGIDTTLGIVPRALGAQDEFFKVLAYRGYIERQAFLHATEQVRMGALQVNEVAQATRQFMENTSEDVQQAAEEWAKEMTFQNPLGPRGEKLLSALNGVPLIGLIQPFIRTPTNIFKQAAARSPMAVFTARFWNAMQAGGKERDLALTRFAMGTTTAALINHYVIQGNITGGGPVDSAARALWLADGRIPYGIKIGNTWHSYASWEPLASVIGATADATTILSHLQPDTETYKDDSQLAYSAASSIVAGIMNNTGNKTFMQGIAQFTEMLSDPTTKFPSWVKQIAPGLVTPFSGALRDIRNISDPYLREAWTINDKIKDGLPGYSKDLPYRLGLFGAIREKPAGSLLGAMSVIPESMQQNNSVVREMQHLVDQTNKVPSTMPSRSVDGGAPMPLTAREYSKFVDIARGQPIFEGGTVNYHDRLLDLIDSDVYKEATPLTRVELMKQVQQQADQLGRIELENQDAAYAERLANWRLKVARLKGQ